MKSILAGAVLAFAISAAAAQTMPNANQTPEQSNSGSAMPNANRTPEGANNLPNGDGTLTPSTGVSPYGTTGIGPVPTPQPTPCTTGAACPACPQPPVPAPAGSPQTIPSPQCPVSPIP